jgi:tRNA(Arg) A34 adenosine deaminase TadA
MTTDEQFLKQALELARQARESPVRGVARPRRGCGAHGLEHGHHRAESDGHAEHNLVADAIRQFSPDQIARCVLYTSCEPCAMCVGAMYWAGIRSMVYGLPAELLANLAGPNFLIPCRDLFSRASDTVHMTGPLLVKEALEVHNGFWSPPSA